jgi:hypothetical protein
VQEPIKVWLGKHGENIDARFVYKSWLDAGGDKELVQEPIKVWLGKNRDNHEADFVYKAWLDAGGAFSVVSSYAILWLHQNYNKEEAVYLTKFLAKQRDIPIETVKDILMWCQRFPNSDDTLWRFTQLSNHLLKDEVAEDVIITSETILLPLILNETSLTIMRRSQITTLFSYLINAHKLKSGQLRNRVDELFLTWLRNPTSFGDNPKPYPNLQRPSYVQRVVDLLVSGALDVTVDYEPLARFLYWVDSWEPEKKSQLSRKFYFLKQNFPAPSLWDIVKMR